MADSRDAPRLPAVNVPPDEAPLPVREAMLDDAALRALLRDIRALTEVDDVIVKRGPGRVGDDAGAHTVDDAERLLRERAVRAVQIRYRHDGARWWDTLMLVPEGVRLVRVRHGT